MQKRIKEIFSRALAKQSPAEREKSLAGATGTRAACEGREAGDPDQIVFEGLMACDGKLGILEAPVPLSEPAPSAGPASIPWKLFPEAVGVAWNRGLCLSLSWISLR